MTRSLAAVVGVALVAAVLAAPVPKVQKNQWAFASDGHIYLFTEGDQEPKKLTDGESVNTKPAWSPDGKQISFCSTRTGSLHVYTTDADGKNEKQITQGDADRRGEMRCDFPSWHPDGKSIVFVRSFSGKCGESDTEICIVQASDGSGLRVLSNSDDDCPSFSPDGKSIALLSARDPGGGYRLYMMDSDGRNATKLSDEIAFGSETRPSWSPDGKAIAFGIDANRSTEIHVIRADGTGLKALTKFGRLAAWPTWSPDGKQIAFVLRDYLESCDSKHSLWVMDADGKNQREILKMSNPPLAYPAWRPK
jgi:TolB protein